jgi:hypothetical protein
VVVDHTLGRFAGRIYIGTLSGYPVYTVGIFRSEYDGHTFIGPVEVASGGGEVGVIAVDPQVLSDGTLLDAAIADEARRFMPEIRVNVDDVLGVLWLDTRDNKEEGL